VWEIAVTVAKETKVRRRALLLVFALLALAGLCVGCAPEASASGTHALLDGIALVSPSEGWAVGEAGTILHLSGGRWSAVASPTSADLYGVALASADEGWAVGLDVARGHGVMLHLSHGRWSLVPGVATPALRAVALVAPGEGWAVGDGGTMLHLTGARWLRFSGPTSADLYGLSMLSPAEGWATGFSINNAPTGAVYDSTILTFAGGHWGVAGTAHDTRLFAVAATPQLAWLVGESAPGGGTILFGSGGLFTLSGGDVHQALQAVALATPNAGWAVGFDGVLYQDSFNHWEMRASPTTTDLYALALISPADGWAVGNDGVILRLRNGSWNLYTG
jgi:hypothetical protein